MTHTKSSPENQPQPSVWGKLSIKTKATIFALCVSILPVASLSIIHQISDSSNQTNSIELRSSKSSHHLLLLGSLGTALCTGIAAYLIGDRTLSAISATTKGIEKLTRGELDTRMPVADDQEIAQLNTAINEMVDQFQDRFANLQAGLDQLRIYAETVHAATRGDKQFLFDSCVKEAKKQLNADRVVIYSFEPDWSGSIVAEAVDPSFPRALQDKILDPCIPRTILEQYKRGRVVPTANVQQTNYSPAHLQLLARLSVKASLVVPIVSGDILLGLLVAHQCSNQRIWQPREIDLLKELATQVGLSLSSITLAAAKAAEAERVQRWQDIVPQIRRSLRTSEILDTAASAVREALQTDRVLICQHVSPSSAQVLSQSTAPGWSRFQGQTISTSHLSTTNGDGSELVNAYGHKSVSREQWLGEKPRHSNNYREQSTNHQGQISERQGQVNNQEGQMINYEQFRLVDRLDEGNLSDWELTFSEQLSIKTYMMAPIFKDGKFFGTITASGCAKPRIWLEAERDLFVQTAEQIGFALLQADLLAQQEVATFLAQQLSKITSRIRESFQVEEIYQVAMKGVRETLHSDRVLVYLFDENWQGTVVAESVGEGWPIALGAFIPDPCLADAYVAKYQEGMVTAVANIYEAGLTKCYLNQLAPFQVKANLVAPIMAEGSLLGLLVTHQCSGSRVWQESEINFFKQVAIQIGFALDQANLLAQREAARIEAELISAQQRQQKEAWQMQLLELLSDVEGAARGDLTVRADVTVGEIGTVADFFNAVIESLRSIVKSVKAAASQVNTALLENEGAMRQLSDQSLQQAQETTRTMEAVAMMTDSITEVAANAQSAAAVAKNASATAVVAQEAMELSVQNILGLRDTIAETAKKVKRLGESSQQISKVVSLINQIALQTNLLAINAGIEAARAGEEGQGFAVVAEEVGSLAARSGLATREIEQIVENIQQETAAVVVAMELGTTQVVQGTHLVEEAKLSLQEILTVSQQIDALVQSISGATVSQAQTSAAITDLMSAIARISEATSNSTRAVSLSLQETVLIALDLQASVGAFQVGD